MMKAALRVSRNCRAHLSDFYVAPWSACLHAFRVTPGTRKAVLRPLPRFNCSNGIRPFFKSLFVYRVFLRFESQLSTKGNRQIPERISRWQRCSAVIGPDQLPSRALPSRNSLSAINERTFGKRSKSRSSAFVVLWVVW